MLADGSRAKAVFTNLLCRGTAVTGGIMEQNKASTLRGLTNSFMKVHTWISYKENQRAQIVKKPEITSQVNELMIFYTGILLCVPFLEQVRLQSGGTSGD